MYSFGKKEVSCPKDDRARNTFSSVVLKSWAHNSEKKDFERAEYYWDTGLYICIISFYALDYEGVRN